MSSRGGERLGRVRRRLSALAALPLAAALIWTSVGTGQEGPAQVNPQPLLGVADGDAELMGAAAAAAPGEAWAYRRLPLDVPPPVIDGKRLEFGGDRSSTAPQLAFLRHTDATGWQVFETPLEGPGGPAYRGFLPNPLSARITPRAGGILVGRDSSRPLGRQARVLQRNPGGRFTLLPDPPPEVLLPAAMDLGAEELAENGGSGAVAVAAVEEGDRTSAFFGVKGRPVQDAVVRYDGSAYSREPVIVPADSTSFEIVAVAATSSTNAFLLARSEQSTGTARGLELYQRVSDAPGDRCPPAPSGSPTDPDPSVCWVLRSLGAPLFEQRDTPERGVSDVGPLGGNAEPLSVTADGVWIDGSLRTGGIAGTEYDLTVYFDTSEAKLTGSWCDAPPPAGGVICDNRLGSSFSRTTGYRSFAFAGEGFGGRVITNPLRIKGNEESNLGTYLRLDGTRFRRIPGGGGNRRRSGAFSSPTKGFLEGPIEVTTGPRPDQLNKFPVSLRTPLTAVDHQPGQPTGALDSRSLAVGSDGAVARFFPERGWEREFLIGSSGGIARSNLRGVDWPEEARAHAVGDLGAMWLWRAETDLWEPDPARPIGFEGNLMDIAFEPGDPQRGYAVGKEGVLLRYDKTFTQEELPAGFEDADFTQVAFAGPEAIVVAGADLLVNRGSGWSVDEQARTLLDEVRTGSPRLFSVAGLPDGGAVAAGRDFVIERDSADGPWRFADQPLINSTVVALGAFRDGERVRAVASVVPRLPYPLPDAVPIEDENVPPPIVPPTPLPGDGYILRETVTGWRDEQRTAFNGSSTDRPIKSDPIAAFDLDANGDGWAIGGWSGEADFAGRGSASRGTRGRADRQRVQTVGIYRYASNGEPASPAGAETSPIAFDTDSVRFAVGGHAQCEEACADLEAQDIAPDRTLRGVLGKAAALSREPRGPRFVLYTGGRTNPIDPDAPQGEEEANRYSELLRSEPALPVFPAVSAGDATGDPPTAEPFRKAFRDFPAPFGDGPSPPNVVAAPKLGEKPEAGEARTHYAFDSMGPAGTVRVIVIDNSAGSLAASDPYQNPLEPDGQAAWLERQLADAKAQGVASVVMGSRDLSSFTPRLNVASDGPATTRLLVNGGASAYFFERPEENRVIPLTSGRQTIPSYGTGTLGYRSTISGVVGSDSSDSLFGDTAFLDADIDVSKRDPATNRAPVTVRTIPVIDDLALQALDGTLLRRSRVALFFGLGRRPIAGDRYGPVAGGDGSPNPSGGDPFVSFPPEQCLIPGCATRLTPQYQFASSNDDIGDFVKQDPASTNLRKPLIDPATDKPVRDASSGLFCAFNSGTTDVTIRAGGLAFTQKVTVLGGSVLRPCGTVALKNPPPAEVPEIVPPPPPPPPPAPVAPAPVAPPPPLPPADDPPPPPPAERPAPPPPPRKVTEPAPNPPPLTISPPVPTKSTDSSFRTPGSNPPGTPTGGQPIPPGGAVARVFQVEEKREEEAAPEESAAFASYRPEEHRPPATLIIAAVLMAALAGATIRGGSRDRDIPRAATLGVPPTRDDYPPNRRRRR